MAGSLVLKRGKEKPLLHHHPWIFSGAVARVENARDGDIVDVYDAAGEWLARAAYNSRSQIAARVWTFDAEESIDRAFFARRLARSVELRTRFVSPESAYRLVNAESDNLPGLVVDRYGDFLVVQFLTLGVESHKNEIVQGLVELCKPLGIYERSDVDVRKREGLPETVGMLYGEEPPDRIEIVENGLTFWVDVKRGHKTGFYLDQRVNRERSAPYLQGEVLNAFAYTGAFGVYAAARNGAQVTNLDSSAPALELARENFARNGVSDKADFIVGDAFEKLREYRRAERKFDAIVLDPPKFVTSVANKERALRGYKDLNLLAFQLLKPNGILVTFSCSGLLDPYLFQQVVFGAAVDARRDAQIVEKLGQSPDHPIGLNFPEGEYLKGLILRVIYNV